MKLLWNRLLDWCAWLHGHIYFDTATWGPEWHFYGGYGPSPDDTNGWRKC